MTAAARRPSALRPGKPAAARRLGAWQMRKDIQASDFLEILGVGSDQSLVGNQSSRSDPQIDLTGGFTPFSQVLEDLGGLPQHIFMERMDGETPAEFFPIGPPREPARQLAPRDNTHLNPLGSMHLEELVSRSLPLSPALSIKRHKKGRIADHASQGERAGFLSRAPASTRSAPRVGNIPLPGFK